ncbi:MAG: energy-coupling factor ABC transporter permease [Aminipila sp.]
MHMADALLSPSVGVAMTAVGVGAISYATVKMKKGDNFDDSKIPLMGVMGAFIFAGQMINFTIPGTGSSGHIGGGILLAALLGSSPALLTISAVLIIQCLFFADGGLLALGANIFNMGFLTSFIAYPLIYRPFVKNGFTTKRITIASILSVVVGLQLGSFAVVLETTLSGITELPFTAFLVLMQPIHLAIGIIEGIVTASVLCFIHKTRPATLDGYVERYREYHQADSYSYKKILFLMLLFSIITAGILSFFASTFPDGLEWSIEGLLGSAELENPSSMWHQIAVNIQDALALMPDYAYKAPILSQPENMGTGVAGLTGGLLTLLLALITGFVIKALKRKHI